MHYMSFLCITVIGTSIPVATGRNLSYRGNPCGCRPHCQHHESTSNGEIALWKSTVEKGKIFCLSPQPIKWTLGTNSHQIPHVNSTELLLKNGSQVIDNHLKFCLSLAVIPRFPSWANSVLFARCETNETRGGASGWYRLDNEWEILKRGFLHLSTTWDGNHSDNEAVSNDDNKPSASRNFSVEPTAKNSSADTSDFAVATLVPNVTLRPNDPIDEEVKTDEEPSVNLTISVEPLDNTSQQSTAHHSPSSNPINRSSTVDSSSSPKHLPSQSTTDHLPSVPLTIVLATAGGAAAFLVLLLIVVVILVKKVKEQRKEIEMTNEEIDEFMLGVAAEKAQAKGINGLFILPYDTKLEIQKSDVIFRSTILGSGAFGQVVQGMYQGSQVAIKMLKNNANCNTEYLRSLLGELKVMSYLGSHPNLVRLLGAITRNIKKGEAYLIFEYCSCGNAHKFVRDHRDNFVNMLVVQPPRNTAALKRLTGLSRLSKLYNTVRHGIGLTTKDLVRWSYEVASGMEYVASRNVYHGDLAARNILLMDDLTAKIGDFGLSKQVDMESYNCYVQKKECPLPLKWMAIESLRDLKFSIQSDIWSFGVAVWELFTLGTIPYPGMEWNFESWKMLCEGKRLDKPEYASDSIYDIMTSCWNADPKSRPAFAELRDLLYKELEKL